MRLIPKSEFKTARWRNGGGVTHEIARSGDGDDFAWRLSVAEVNASGPFSLFPRHDRILTVIEGAGMDLVSQDDKLLALPFAPVRFSGAVTITGQLIEGPCRDFNLIYDPRIHACDVQLVSGPVQLYGAGGLLGLFLLSGNIGLAGVETGDFVFLDEMHDAVALQANASALLVTIEQR